MSVDVLLSEVAGRDLAVTQLHQRVSHPAQPNTPSVVIGGWWCELRHKNGWRDSDSGETAEEALRNALQRAKGLKGRDNRPINQLDVMQRAHQEEINRVANVMTTAIGAKSKKASLDFLD